MIYLLIIILSNMLIDRYLKDSLKFIDKDRIGVWGKGYGGYATGMILAKQPDVFRCGIATSPVTNWAHFGNDTNL